MIKLINLNSLLLKRGVFQIKTIILDDWENYMINHPATESLKTFSEVRVFNDRPDKNILLKRLQNTDAVITIRERTKFNKELVDKLPKLKLIAQTGKGVKHLDMESINKQKIPVSITPGGSKSAMTELTFSFLLSLLKKTHETNLLVKNNEWPEDFIGANLESKTLGIIGLGQIGTSVAKMAQVFGMHTLAWGPTLTRERAAESEVVYKSLEELLKVSDAISIHLRLVPETKNLIKYEHFKLMKDNVVLVNTSRGSIINENDLIKALENSEISAAGLDVFEEEPLPENHPLKKFPNTILTPHIGWKTDDTFDNFINESVKNIESFFVDEKPRNILNKKVLK